MANVNKARQRHSARPSAVHTPPFRPSRGTSRLDLTQSSLKRKDYYRPRLIGKGYKEEQVRPFNINVCQKLSFSSYLVRSYPSILEITIMKSSIISTVLAVVATTSASAVSIVPRVRTQSNFVWSKNVHRPTPQIDQMCIHFENSVDTWYYSFQGPWGQSSGQASNEGDICVPTSNDAGGAMFIGLEVSIV